MRKAPFSVGVALLAGLTASPHRVSWAALAARLSSPKSARWIAPDYSKAPEPKLRPVDLYWFAVRETPYVYRIELATPEGTNRITALARSAGFLYVWVDGERVWAYSVPKKKGEKKPKPDPSKVHEVDLTPWLARPGRHCLAVSAPREGFVLDGGFYAGTNRLARLGTDKNWRVVKLPPTTIIEDLQVTRTGYDGDSAPVKEGEEFTAGEDDLARAYWNASVARLASKLDDAKWRLELLVKKGIYIVDDEPQWWGGPRRLNSTVVRRTEDALRRVARLQADITAVKTAGALLSATTLSQALARLPSAEVEAVSREADALSGEAHLADERNMLQLASRLILIADRRRDFSRQTPEELAKLRTALALRHPLPRLNVSRYDRLGWIPLPGLSDDQIGKWGIRVNPVTGPTTVRAPRRWYFKPDPQNTGIDELRWSIGYNIEGQWPKLDVGRPWQAHARFRDYRGIAWYRTRVHIPDEWAGNGITLKYRARDADRLWFNDEEVTKLGSGEVQRVYTIPARLVSYGGDNHVAIRVEGRGDKSGVVGGLTASCPALDRPEAKSTPPTEVFSTPLSPCVVLEPKTETLDIHHRPGVKLILTPNSIEPAARPPVDYRRDRDGKLPANWVILWMLPATPAGVERPILLVFQVNPASIEGTETVTRVSFPRPGARLIAVRPWVKEPPRWNRARIEKVAGFWSRAALAIPVNYASITRVVRPGESIKGINVRHVPRGPVLGHTVVYDYHVTKDEWGTKPLKLAPLPALCSFALDTRFRALKIEGRIETLQDGGMLAPYRAVKNADRVSYSYEVEPFPRRIGFTSFAFSGADVGVRGNWREMELIAAGGANSYRPQHNFGEHESPHYKGKTRVRIMVDVCKAMGVNYTNNIDQTLGMKREYVREKYDQFMGDVIRHYEGIARQLRGEPFWAVGYDLVNEAFDHHHTRYNPAMKKLTAAVRAIDPVHLCYIEPCESWGAIQQLALIEPTGDPLTVYSFHDYNFRLKKATDRWPTLHRDITDICRMWLPVFVYAVRHGTGMHCGEFGGFGGPTFQKDSQKYLMADFFKIFDQFGMHFHYYSGRDCYERCQDGSVHPSNVVRAFRKYAARPGVNLYYRDKLWKTHPDPNGLARWAVPVRASVKE